MIVDLNFDSRLELRFYFGGLPSSLMAVLGEQKQALYESTGPFSNYGSTGVFEVEASGRRFRVYVRVGDIYTGEGGDEIGELRVTHVEDLGSLG